MHNYAVIIDGSGGVHYSAVQTPTLEPHEVLIQSQAVGICGTDLEIVTNQSRRKVQEILGHEWSGVVVAAGGEVSPTWHGSRVVGSNVVSEAGDSVIEIGFERPGAFAALFKTHSSLLRRVPDSVPHEAACLAEPVSVACRAIAKSPPRAGQALVVGAGAVGSILAALLTRQHRIDVLFVDVDAAKVARGRRRGLGHGLNFSEASPEVQNRFRLVFEASGTPAGMRLAVEAAGRGGRVVFLGSHYDPDVLSAALRKELTLTGSNTGQGYVDEALAALAAGVVRPEDVGTGVYTVDAIQTGLFDLRSGRVGKVVFRHNTLSSTDSSLSTSDCGPLDDRGDAAGKPPSQ